MSCIDPNICFQSYQNKWWGTHLCRRIRKVQREPGQIFCQGLWLVSEEMHARAHASYQLGCQWFYYRQKWNLDRASAQIFRKRPEEFREAKRIAQSTSYDWQDHHWKRPKLWRQSGTQCVLLQLLLNHIWRWTNIWHSHWVRVPALRNFQKRLTANS